ncbi:hypothetical protein [Terrisporobacter sp.]|uniref:hypothetical protein n=1 Tax=Terrisporobacter sp. TaxID=1965305 RepID=UPI003991E917
MEELIKKYPENYKKLNEIRISVNKTSELINELGDLPITGVDNIDNMYIGLHRAHSEVIKMFLTQEEE